ncbi:MAG: hypothetical protein QG622_547 [Actinomycetota bacterium]|nr:hypothetical protein [Actinomycetota bacterium]
MSTPSEVRASFRSGSSRTTAGLADGFQQANLVAVPAEHAFDFLLFAVRNPAPCPIVDVVEAGRWTPSVAPGADLRTDLPAYRVWRDGDLVAEPGDVTGAWRDDLVSFLLGCSFTFEHVLVAAGIPLRHLATGGNVAMYDTTRPCRPAGVFSGNLVVSMRPIPAGRVDDVVRICSALPWAHGAPVHVGDPAALGIADLARPDYGDAAEVAPGEVPVFWACGVTPQNVLRHSRIPFAITHAPGHMFVTDRPADAAP